MYEDADPGYMDPDYPEPYGWMDVRYDIGEEHYVEAVMSYPEGMASARSAGERMVGAYERETSL